MGTQLERLHRVFYDVSGTNSNALIKCEILVSRWRMSDMEILFSHAD